VVAEIFDEDSSASSVKSGRSQLVDLVIEDTEAEERERVRARKEGGAEWNEEEIKYFVYVISTGSAGGRLANIFLGRCMRTRKM
jgi:hypothetical protein